MKNWVLDLLPGKQNWLIWSVSFCLFWAGYGFSQRSWNHSFFVALSAADSRDFNRQVASARTLVLKKPASSWIHHKDHAHFLVKNSKVEYQPDLIVLRIAHPVIQLRGGGRDLISRHCQFVNILFKAVGEFNHGHSPEMNLKIPCSADNEDLSYLPPMIIPRKDILASSPKKQLFHTPGQGILLFNHLAFHWPKKWILKEISFTGKQPPRSLVFSSPHPQDYLWFTL